jgi:hypothetical protein
MGRKVRLNWHLIPLLRCIEKELTKECTKSNCLQRKKGAKECNKYSTADGHYQPRILSGLRTRNTFKGSEISNHVYGIALDLDPKHNTCCGCVGKWKTHPKCKKALPIEQRMIMPMCWVDSFKRYGFYWLGDDTLRDTMHFEFLASPQLIENAYAVQRAKNVPAKPSKSQKKTTK